MGGIVLIFSMVSDAVATWDGALYTLSQKQHYHDSCTTGTIPEPMLAGLALLSVAMALTIVGSGALLATTGCGCTLCCLSRGCCDPFSHAATSLGTSIALLVLSLPLFLWNIACVAASLAHCRSARVDNCFIDGRQNLDPDCVLTMARAGVGSMAGLAGCVSVILAGNFVYLAETVNVSALRAHATPSVVFVAMQGEADAVDQPADIAQEPSPPACR